MRIFRSLDDVPHPPASTAVTIGNFDGVHLGHREMFRRLVSRARDMGGESLVVTFRPHPLKVLVPDHPLRLINTYEEKETLIGASGVDALLVIPFRHDLAAMAPERFVREVLVQALGMRHLVVGYDYAFGQGRKGDTALLRTLGEECGYTLELLEPIGKGGLVYSSTAVRRMVKEGDVAGTVAILGRQFSLEGTVTHGHHRGRNLGFPTANLVTEKELIPRDGVYAVKVKLGDRIHDGACNIGTNPTFGNDGPSIEVHIIDFDGELYGCELRVYFMERIRDERTFADYRELAFTIARDVERCRQILADVTLIGYRDYLGTA
jgi:riboflavin kinase/FMN adenylyltransferase